MMNYLISVPINNGIADFIGKKGSADSITYYNRIIGDDTIVSLVPTDLDEKIYGLGESLTLSDQIVLDAVSIDKKLGEILIASSLIGKRLLVVKNDTLDMDKLDGLLKNLGISYELCDRSNVLDKILEHKEDKSENGNCRIDIDKAFKVKGIGTVVLGIVKKGTVKVHDKLYINELKGKEVVVKSIQSQDRDMAESKYNTRVGLALKGAEPEDFNKGDKLVNYDLLSLKEVNCKLDLSKINPSVSEDKSFYTFISNFSYTNASLSSDGDNYIVKLDKAIYLEKGDAFMLSRNDEPRLFAKGSVN